jgi:two-component system chemotaxis response regulator CheB
MRILIVDDSALYRKILSEAAGALPGVTAVSVPNAELALSKLASEPVDLVLLDIFMPDRNGPEVLAEIKSLYPKQNVVMVSGATGRDAGITLEALSNGAIDFIAKPAAGGLATGAELMKKEISRVLDTVRQRSSASDGTPRPATPQAAAPRTSMPAFSRSRTNPPAFLDLVLIGVSTGGPKALGEMLARLSPDFPVPILIVQHMPAVFTLSLAGQLDRVCPLQVKEADDRRPLKAGEVLIAPGGRHLEMVKDEGGALSTRITDTAPVHSCRPSVDVLFESAARCRLRGVVSVVLTGMGSDGAEGLEKLKACSPVWSIAQNAATCAVYGMPQAVVNAGLADEVLPLAEIGPRLNQIFRVS